MKIVVEEPFSFPDLNKRIDSDQKIKFIKNGPRGILIDDITNRQSWADVGYRGDDRKNRYSIEVRARNGRTVAAIAWTPNSEDPRVIYTLGTYVSKKMRRRGIATSLWRAMIYFIQPKKIWSEPVSHEGLTLLNSLRETFKDTVKIGISKNQYFNELIDLRGEE